MSSGSGECGCVEATTIQIELLRDEIRALTRALESQSIHMLNVPEVAAMFGVCEQTVLNRVKAGKWPAWRDGRQIRFSPEDIEAIKSQGRPKLPLLRESSFERRQRNKLVRSGSQWIG